MVEYDACWRFELGGVGSIVGGTAAMISRSVLLAFDTGLRMPRE
jgi:hypothetical protein